MLTSILLTGVGGQGVVTMANLITSHLEQKGVKVSLIHATGMAQRGGRVTSEVRFSDDRSASFGPRISAGGADFLIGMDIAETINSIQFMKPGGCLVFNNYTLVPSQAVLRRERFPDGDEAAELFTGLAGKIVRIRDAGQPVNLFVLGVFSAVCEKTGVSRGILNPGSLEETLKMVLTKRVDENLSAFRNGAEYGRTC